MSLLWTRRVLAGGMLAAPFIRAASAQQSLEWVAGSLGGGWYTMAAGLSSLIKDENPDIQIRVVPGGGLANSTRVNRNTSPIGWGIDAFAASARRGEEPYKEAHTALRCLGSGYSPTEHHLLRRKAGEVFRRTCCRTLLLIKDGFLEVVTGNQVRATTFRWTARQERSGQLWGMSLTCANTTYPKGVHPEGVRRR